MFDVIKYTIGFGMLKGQGYQDIAASVRFNILWYIIEALGFPLLLVLCYQMGWRESMWWIFSIYVYTLIFIGILNHILNVMAVNICGYDATDVKFASYKMFWGWVIVALWSLFIFQMGTLQYWNVWFALFIPLVAMIIIFHTCAFISKLLVLSSTRSGNNDGLSVVIGVGVLVLIYNGFIS